MDLWMNHWQPMQLGSYPAWIRPWWSESWLWALGLDILRFKGGNSMAGNKLVLAVVHQKKIHRCYWSTWLFFVGGVWFFCLFFILVMILFCFLFSPFHKVVLYSLNCCPQERKCCSLSPIQLNCVFSSLEGEDEIRRRCSEKEQGTVQSKVWSLHCILFLCHHVCNCAEKKLTWAMCLEWKVLGQELSLAFLTW